MDKTDHLMAEKNKNNKDSQKGQVTPKNLACGAPVEAQSGPRTKMFAHPKGKSLKSSIFHITEIQ
jgi:hypothetical protein